MDYGRYDVYEECEPEYKAVEPAITITNWCNEKRTIVSASWAGDTLFFFDEHNLAYERSEVGCDGEDMYEQLSSGDRWYSPHVNLASYYSTSAS